MEKIIIENNYYLLSHFTAIEHPHCSWWRFSVLLKGYLSTADI